MAAVREGGELWGAYVRSRANADSCDQSNVGYCVTCLGLSSDSCVLGKQKTLCEQCVGVQQE